MQRPQERETAPFENPPRRPLAEVQLDLALAEGRFADAADAVAEATRQLGDAMPLLLRIYRAEALLLAGRPADAAAAGDQVETTLKQPPVSRVDTALLAIAEHLEHRLPAAPALAATRDSGEFALLPHAYFALAVRAAAGHRAEARQLFDRSAHTALNLEFPYLAAKALAAAAP